MARLNALLKSLSVTGASSRVWLLAASTPCARSALTQVLAECQAQGDKLVVFSEMLDNLGEVETILQQEYGWAEGREYLRCAVKLWLSCTSIVAFVRRSWLKSEGIPWLHIGLLLYAPTHSLSN
jgi:hypothetical protein